jgi:hypothetical protein
MNRAKVQPSPVSPISHEEVRFLQGWGNKRITEERRRNARDNIARDKLVGRLVLCSMFALQAAVAIFSAL